MNDPSVVHGQSAGIGSLPHVDADEAVALALEVQPRLATAPSLPNRSPLEGMIAQAAWGIPGVDVLPDGSLRVDDPLLDPTVPLDGSVRGEPFEGFRAFATAIAGRVMPVKVQLTGPVTLGLALHTCGVPAARAFPLAGRAVRARALATISTVRASAPVAPIVAFVDEPGLTGAMHPGFPLDPTATLDLVSSALAALEPHAVTGLHCCGAADWPMLLQAGPQILSLPVGAGAVDHAATIGEFLDRGGVIAWGAVPTTGPRGSSAARLWEQLSAEWCGLTQGGCDPMVLRDQAMITPACGLANHDPAQAEAILSLSNQLARRLRTQTQGVRLTVGA